MSSNEFSEFEDDFSEVDDIFSGCEPPLIPKPTLDALMEAPHEENVLLAHLSGQLKYYLAGCGWNTETDLCKVIRELELRYPTLEHETDALYELLERQLVEDVFSPMWDFPELVEDGVTEYAEISAKIRLGRQKLLFAVRERRCELKDKLNQE